MKQKLLPLLLAVCTAVPLFAQTESPAMATAAAAYEKNFNLGDFEAIYNQFSPEMQQALPRENAVPFLRSVWTQAGKITDRELLIEEDGEARYKAVHERAVFELTLAVNEAGQLAGLLIRPYTEPVKSTLARNLTPMGLPFKGEWTVVWGGDTKEQNYHVETPAQKGAFDLVITDEKESSYRTTGETNEDYYAFGQEIYAPCDAEVLQAVDGIMDNVPGEMNRWYVPGNSVMLKTANNEYILLAHFKQNSVTVKAGDRVKRGQLLGLCGNSGNSSEAHLHFHIQSAADFSRADGVKCYFDQLLVNGEMKENHSPVQNEKVKQP